MTVKKHSKTTTNREAGHETRLAQEAFERIKPSLAEIPEDRVERPRLDLQAVAIVARQVSRLVAQPDVRRRFEELPRSLFDLARLDQLRDLSLAAWYARNEADDEEAAAAGGLPAIAEQAREVKHRMIRVLEYSLDHDTRVVDRLESIRGGVAYVDLAADLNRLAKLYREHRDVLRKDAIRYRAEDAALAESFADRILDRLGERQVGVGTDLLYRLWTRLHEVYEDVRHAGAFVFRGEPLAVEFPSLHSAIRARPHLRADEEEPGVAPEAPAPAPAAPPVAPAPDGPAGTRDA